MEYPAGLHKLNTASGDLLARIMDLLLDAICVVDSEGRYVFVSAACERLFGYAREELIGRNMIDLVHPDDRERTLQAAEDIMRGHPMTHFENRYIRKDGRVIHVMWTASWSSADRVRVAVARDITEYRKSAQVQGVLYGIVEAAYDADDMVTLCRRLHEVIVALLPAEGFSVALYDASSGTVSSPYDLEHGHATEERTWQLDPASPLAEVIRSEKGLLISGAGQGTGGGAAVRDEPDWLGVPLFSAQGLMGALVLRAGPGAGGFTPENRRLLQFISHKVAEAIERKQADLKIRHRAYFDLLTGLPNRTLFDDRFDMALKRARRDGENLAILYLDLDGFKRINDELGHEAGDQLLRQIAARLGRCIRDSDTVGRRGGDEFTVLLTNIHGMTAVDMIIAKIHAAIEEPIQVDGRAIRVSASIGAAVFPADGESREFLYRHADERMYAVKRAEQGARPGRARDVHQPSR